MPGQLCTGTTIKNGTIRDSKAFCEGMAYRTTGSAVAAPKANNPHAAGSDAAIAWDNGWDIADAAGGSTIGDAFCCALRGASVPA